jgi:hypothetical protein
MRARDRRGAILEKGAIREGCYTTRFHVSLLEPANLETLVQRTFRYETEEDNEFKVENLLRY